MEQKTSTRLATNRWPTPRSVGLFVTMAALGLLLAAVSAADSPACPVPVVQRQRYGFVATAHNWPLRFDYADLKAGWYVDAAHGGYDVIPEGMDRALPVGVYTGYTVDRAWLGPLVDNNPGVIWLVGNEPDCIYQDDVWPEEYARIYHDLYTFIKNRDLTAQVSPGGIVQPTPLRLQYLDRVLAAYQAQYGGLMPVDMWNIHNAILNEVSCDYNPSNCWGAGIPPGIDAQVGEIRDFYTDNDNIDLFEAQIWAMRQWMADRGYGGYPLVISEYGILMPAMYGYTESRVNAFMSATFGFLENTADAALGDPTDSHRLVQRWAWFSLDAPPFEWPTATQGFNGNLFDPVTTDLTAHGEHFISHPASFPPVTYVDLGISAWTVLPTTDLAGPTETISRSVQVRVANVGTADSGSLTVTVEYDGPLSGTLQQSVGTLPPVSSQWLHFTLANLQPGAYSLTLWVDPDDEVIESRECNNLVAGRIVAPTDRLYLPVAPRLGAGASSPPAPVQTVSEPQSLARVRPSDVVPGFQEFQVPTPGGYPVQIALDAQGAVWITEHEGNKIGRFDPQTKTWTEYDIPTPDGKPWGLALDGAGNVWFAETEADQIGRLIVSSGTFSEYQTLADDSQPWGIAIGDDGTIWFTEKNANQIGKLVPSTGAMTAYPLPTSGAQPASIASRGIHVWFTEPAADKIGRLKTLDGSIYEFNPPTVDSVPQDLVLSPSGDPWFTEMAADQIALFHVSTLGLFFEFPVQTPNSEPFGIAMEGNVAVWFTERAADKLGRFSGSLPPDEYWLPSPNSQPTDVVVDSDGCAWYTAPGVNRIGRLCLPVRYSVHLPLVKRDHPSLGAER
jgi:streptogramin lyase